MCSICGELRRYICAEGEGSGHIVEFVPSCTNPGCRWQSSQKVKCDSRLELGAIVSTVDKAMKRWADRQQMAHLIARLKMPEDMN